ncbi:MAG TPA: hypothetical protein VL463_26565 [Kofleriaceae bacterium]|nr:hypothetical protein [Kofleriaceae bacterium]
MRATTVIGFSASFVFFASVAWRATEADIPADGALTRPAQRTLTVGSSKITVDLDRGIMTAGDEVKVSLVGTADMERDVALDLTALEDEGMGDERVPIPPVVVGRRSVIVHAVPGGGAPTVASFHLGHRGDPGMMSWFDVQVTPSKLHPPSRILYDDDGHSAVIGVATWTGNRFGLAIEPPAAPPAPGAPFVVAVRVTNTTKKPIENIYVELGSSRNLDYDPMGGMFAGENNDFTVEAQGNDGDEDALAPGASRVQRFTITPAEGVTKVAILADAHASGGGAMDVREIELVAGEPTPSVARN